ncbi:MAG: 5-oxoprolinase subunit PxpA [Henriciella sp.]
MRKWMDLNADLGEGAPHDAALMTLVSSCNIACGGHAGDAESMLAALTLAKTYNVSPGAHPSYPDRAGFGRRRQTLSPDELESTLTKQIKTLNAIAVQIGTPLTHLKPHGALYNQAAEDAGLASQIARLTQTLLPRAYLVGPPGSALTDAAATCDLKFLAEGFADRAYTEAGTLVPRDEPGAVLGTDSARTQQALSIAQDQCVEAITGKIIPLPAQTLCLHGDSDGALSSARHIAAALNKAGFTLRAPE